MFILAESIEYNDTLHFTGQVMSREMAHLARSRGAVLLEHDKDFGPNGLARFAKRHYAPASLPGGANWLLPGPIVYISAPAQVHWALRFKEGDARADVAGKVSIVPSNAQTGVGMVRVIPLETDAFSLEDDLNQDTMLLRGDFKIIPSQFGFAAFDFYFSYPRGVVPLWCAMSLVPTR
jgi:hypothetical protein